MAEIWTETGFLADDPWVIETEDAKAGSNEKALLPLDDFIARAGAGEQGLGVIVRPADDVARLKEYLGAAAMIAVLFPAFNDGRGFSHASLLRGRLGYTGPVRAVGDVLIDQVPLMIRCGFDSFAVTNATAIQRLTAGRLPGISLHYQPTVHADPAKGSYSWRSSAK